MGDKIAKQGDRHAARAAASQAAAVDIALGDRVRLAVRLEMTPAGIYAVGGLVSMILLGAAAIVGVARQR